MTPVVYRSQLTRLVQLLLGLGSGRYPNAAELAEHCEVSRRTVYRDLATLAAAGVPVRYVPERQGYALAPGFRFDPPRLEERELLALLVLSADGPADPLGLRRAARAAAWKLLPTLPAESRQRLTDLAARIQGPGDAVDLPPRRAGVYEAALAALAEGHQVRLWYLDPADGTEQATKLSPYRLVRSGAAWYLVGRSSYHREVRTIGLPWVRRAEATGESFDLPPRFDLSRHLGRAWQIAPGAHRYRVRLRFDEPAAAVLVDAPPHAGARVEPAGPGRVELTAEVDGLDEILAWTLGFGPSVEVLAPVELRDRLREVALRIARTHAPADCPAAGELTAAHAPLE